MSAALSTAAAPAGQRARDIQVGSGIRVKLVGSSWGQVGAKLEPSRSQVGAKMGSCGGSWGLLGRPGATLGIFGLMLVESDESGPHFGWIFFTFSLQDGSWMSFGVDLGAKLGPSWGQVGAKLGQVGPSWVQDVQHDPK